MSKIQGSIWVLIEAQSRIKDIFGYKGNCVRMAGVILETISNRKLLALGVIALLLQVAIFLIGGIVGKVDLGRYRSETSSRIESDTVLFCYRIKKFLNIFFS